MTLMILTGIMFFSGQISVEFMKNAEFTLTLCYLATVLAATLLHKKSNRASEHAIGMMDWESRQM
ncbi:hypothetical protein Q4485_08080 [Granulosicoccaceae sp. 1_MG-2023]|nr:hypothetical protein [Granulosicoccaceae sp. 1_MG-2023]